MIPNRELKVEDYVAMLRRQLKVILVPALFAPLAGFLVSYVFPPKFTSQALILVEGQKVPASMVQPVVSEDLTARVTTLQQQVLSQSNLQPVVDRLFPGKTTEETAAIVDKIRAGMTVEPVITDLSAIGTTAGKGGPVKAGQSPVPGFYVNFTDSNAREAQQICNELSGLFVAQNLKVIQEAATGTSAVLNRGLDDAKRNLDDLDTKMAAFKKQYEGQLPGDEDNNLKILTGLNSQLEANTQTLNRAQQDKSYAESILAQQIAAWKSSQSSTNPETLQKQLSDLQAELLVLQAKYTDDHPDVIKTKADIAGVKKKLAEINKATADPADAGSEKASAMEPLEIRQLRLQLHQYEELIAGATRDQKRLEQQIALYQGRISLSPSIEEQYKQIARDYDNALKTYDDLLAKKSSADLTIRMNDDSQGERMAILNPAAFPDAPTFPNRLFFALAGLGAGFAVGAGLALLLELQDNSIRNEADAEAALELPMLVAVPWLGDSEDEEDDEGHKETPRSFRFWNRNGSGRRDAEKVGA